METAALILQGRDDYTADEPVAGILPLHRLIHTVKLAGIKRVVVAGEDHIMTEAFKQATRLEVEFIHTTRNKRKKASYRVNALNHLKGKCDKLLLIPIYYPLADIPTVKTIAETDAALAAPTFKGERGYPLLIGSGFYDEMIATDGDYEKLFSENEWKAVEVDDEGVVTDVTIQSDTERIAERLALHNDIRPAFKLTLRRETAFYGPGIQELIRLVEETGSLKQAFILMGMSSSYARRIVKEAEFGLGFKIFDNRDSKYDGSAVTQEAKEFAEKYKAFSEDCDKCVEELYKRHFVVE